MATEQTVKTPAISAGVLGPILSDEDFTRICVLLHARAGISTKPSKRLLVQNRLRPRLRSLGLASYDDYLKRVGNDPKELQSFLDALTTNETFFYREEKHWDYLRDVIIPEVVKARPTRPHFSIWSAAASTGEELYTAAIILSEYLPDPASWTLKLVGTDINQEVLDRARKGVYLPYAVRTTDPKILAKYFDRGTNALGREEWRLKEPIRRLCRFATHNLQTPPTFGTFDLVCCRNVFIYFDKAAKEKAVAHLFNATAPGGYLFFSHTEAMVPRLPAMQAIKPSIFRKVTP